MKKEITKEFYERLVEAFKLAGPNYSRVARIVKCDPSTAKRGWEVGWSSQKNKRWAHPINETWKQTEEAKRIADERAVEARANALASEKIKELEQAKKLAEEAATRARDEAMIEANVRKNVAIALAGSERVLLTANALATRLLQQMFETRTDAMGNTQLVQPLRMKIDAPPMAPWQVAKFVKDAAYLAKTGAEAAQMSMAISKNREGKPVGIFGIQFIDQMTDEEVASQLLQISRAGMILTQGAQAVDQDNEYVPEGDDYDPKEPTKELANGSVHPAGPTQTT